MHRDLKPENILLQTDQIETGLKVIDFGRSKLLRMEQKLVDLAGSIYYVAPEVISGQGYNELCDIWSCGVILYMIIAGEPPFYNGTQEQIKDQIKCGRVQYTSKEQKRSTEPI